MAAQLVLLHSPLVGPQTWSALALPLRARGYAVSVPDYSGALRGGAAPYYEKIVRIASASVASGSPIVLIAHSGAGVLVPAIAANCNARAAIFVDAQLPHPGKSWFDTAPNTLRAHLRNLARNGRVPPWHAWWPGGAIEKMLNDSSAFEHLVSDAHDVPLAFFEEPAPSAPLAKGLRCAYLQLNPGYESEAEEAGRLGWLAVSFPRHHLAMLTHPEDVAAELDDLLSQMA